MIVNYYFESDIALLLMFFMSKNMCNDTPFVEILVVRFICILYLLKQSERTWQNPLICTVYLRNETYVTLYYLQSGWWWILNSVKLLEMCQITIWKLKSPLNNMFHIVGTTWILNCNIRYRNIRYLEYENISKSCFTPFAGVMFPLV